ncbi:conotoxin-like protein [Hemileuca sp. nucleopolyhedrovirus]|uniref:Conotoxin-like protein n=1 Tax=Hemileuca sp. nucleopolyhedrovirus TaxID=1367203 RepID=S5N371_9ABAC|nr:conotoxin-like protein [Hemileuca sp. nucleopolyhedrovirus]AGR56805.1 conotoxin-like protein [Hemileuca sp. nucleopolyhedrovirus]
MKLNTFMAIVTVTMAYIVSYSSLVLACTETGRNCKYSDECCSGACSAAFGFCLHR